MSASRVDDRRHMARALQLAARGLNTTHPNPRVGCVIAAGADGHRARAGTCAPAAPTRKRRRWRRRAAPPAARRPTSRWSPAATRGRTPPCTAALIAAGIRRVVYGAADPESARQRRRRAGAAGGGHRGQRRSAGRRVGAPQRRLHAPHAPGLAAGADARSPPPSTGARRWPDGRSQWLTGEAAREDVQRWRARSAAILTGVGTVLADDPALTVREAGQALPVQPLRVILDSRLPHAAGRPDPRRSPGDVAAVRRRGATCKRARACRPRGALVEAAPVDAGPHRPGGHAPPARRTRDQRGVGRGGPDAERRAARGGPDRRARGVPGGQRARRRVPAACSTCRRSADLAARPEFRLQERAACGRGSAPHLHAGTAAGKSS